MKKIALSLLMLSFLTSTETGKPLPWRSIQIDGGEELMPFDNKQFVDALVQEYGFSEAEGLEIVAGIYRGKRITYIDRHGTILPKKHKHCTII